MTEAEFRQIAALIKEWTGVDLSQKKTLIQGRLERTLVQNGFQSYSELIQYVKNDRTGKAQEELISLLTTHHTYFLREPIQFDLFRDQVLPVLREKEKETRDLRIWSAASSTGEEAYTLAMIMNDFFGIAQMDWETTILATDVSKEVVQLAAKGVYEKEQIDGLPPQWKSKYFSVLPNQNVQIKGELRKNVVFRSFNLMDPFPFRKKFHVIFLRNVMIYFEGDTKHQLLCKIKDFLEPGGYLFVGTTEAIDRKAYGLNYVMPSVYRKEII